MNLLELHKKRKEERMIELSDLYARIDDKNKNGCGCGKGWYNLLKELDVKLSQIDPTYTVYQFKEKFGILRFYAECHSDNDNDKQKFKDVVNEAQQASSKICENCGKPGTSNNSRLWVKTLCVDCNNQPILI